MKLKEKPLEWWKGKRYTYWCRADVNDQRKIHYTLNWYSESGPRVEHFTSEDSINPLLMQLIRSSVIQEIKLIDNEWHVILDG